MARVLRIDAGALKRPEKTPQGFLRVDGYAGRVGVYEYPNDDGTVSRELRLDEEVFSPKTLASFDGAPITDGHPTVPVTAKNVRTHEVGTVMGAARKDGRHVATTLLIKDGATIRKVEGGVQELSPGYELELDETPGVHPVHGRYDAIQRNIVVNHLAIVPGARGGSTVRMRMDSGAEVLGREHRRDEALMVTVSIDGHQHTLEPNGPSGCTSWSQSEGADCGHSHDWLRNSDGSLTLTENAGHTHAIEPQVRVDRNDSKGRTAMADPVKPDNRDDAATIRSLGAQLTTAQTEAATATAAAKAAEDKAGVTQGRLDAANLEIEQLKIKVAAVDRVTESEAIKTAQSRADAAEDKIRRFDAELDARVEARAALLHTATAVMGPSFQHGGMSSTAIERAVVKRLDSNADVGNAVSDAVIHGRFLAATERHAGNAVALARVSAALHLDHEADRERADQRADVPAWKKPLPSAALKNA